MELIPDKFIENRDLPSLCLDKSFSDIKIVNEHEDEFVIPGTGKIMICHRCQSIITSRNDLIFVLGSNIHSKINPAGFAYQFECYSKAPGCAVIGEPSAEHSWFSGYLWQMAFCEKCSEHLGWFFKCDTRFYGLIKGRIIEQQYD